MQRVIEEDESRIKLIAGGERAGKSLVSSMILVEKGWGDLYWLVGNDYEACRGEWNHLLEFYERLKLLESATKNIDPGEIMLTTGTSIVTKSAKYLIKLGTTAPDGIVMSEAAQMDYEIYLRLRHRLAEKRGWMVLAGTFEAGQQWYRDLWERWQGFNEEEARSFSLPTWSNTAIFPGGRNDEEILKIERDTPEDIFKERFGGVPCPPTGLVIKEFSNAVHVGNYEFDYNYPVEITVDPGYAGAHALLALQEHDGGVYIIDEVYLQGIVTQDMIDICRKKIWWNYVKGGTIDIAGKQHQAMEAPVEIWLNSAGISLRSNKVPIEAGIDLMRTHLKVNPLTLQPTTHINVTCKGLISECGGCKSPVEGGGAWMRDKNTLVPIDKNNHACKSYIYWLVGKYGYSNRMARVKPMRLGKVSSRSTFARR